MKDPDGDFKVEERGIFSSVESAQETVAVVERTSLSSPTGHAPRTGSLTHETVSTTEPPPTQPPLWKWKRIDHCNVKTSSSPVCIEYIAKMTPQGTIDVPLFMDQLTLCRNCNVRIWLQSDHPLQITSCLTGETVQVTNTSRSKQWRLLGLDTQACRNLQGIRLASDYNQYSSPVVYRQDDYFAVTIYKPPYELVEEIEPHKIVVYWDTSGSHYAHCKSYSIPLFQTLLLHWFHNKARQQLDLVVVPFSYKKHKAQRFLVSSEDDFSKVRHFLLSELEYNGLTKLECLFKVPTPLERDASFCVLFTDGVEVLHSRGRNLVSQKLQSIGSSIFTIAVSPDRNAAKLRHIAHCTGGQFFDFGSKVDEMVQHVGKPVFSLSRLVYDADKIEQVYPSHSIPVNSAQPVQIVGKLKDGVPLGDCILEIHFGFAPVITDRLRFNIGTAEGEYQREHSRPSDYTSYFTSYLEFDALDRMEEPMRNFLPCLVGDVSLSELETFPVLYKDDILSLSSTLSMETIHSVFSKQQNDSAKDHLAELKREWCEALEWYDAQMKHRGNVEESITTRLVQWVQTSVIPAVISALERAEEWNNEMWDSFLGDAWVMENEQYTSALLDAYPTLRVSKESESLVEEWLTNLPTIGEALASFVPWNSDSAKKVYAHLRQWHHDANGNVHPSIYMAIGQLFMKHGLVEEGLHIVQNVVETFPRNNALFPALSRSVALAHLHHGHAETACELLLFSTHSYPAENPVHLIELAYCFEELKDVVKALDLLLHIVGSSWPDYYGSIRLLALRELNRICYSHKELSLPAEYGDFIRHTPLDLRLVLSCDTDPFHDALYEIIEPTGTVVSLQEPFSKSTGSILSGVGMEEYLLPRSLHSSFGSSRGTYIVKYALEGASQVYTLLGSAHIYCRVYRSFQRHVEQVEKHMLPASKSDNAYKSLLKIRVDKNADLWRAPQNEKRKESTVCSVM